MVRINNTFVLCKQEIFPIKIKVIFQTWIFISSCIEKYLFRTKFFSHNKLGGMFWKKHSGVWDFVSFHDSKTVENIFLGQSWFILSNFLLFTSYVFLSDKIFYQIDTISEILSKVQSYETADERNFLLYCPYRIVTSRQKPWDIRLWRHVSRCDVGVKSLGAPFLLSSSVKTFWSQSVTTLWRFCIQIWPDYSLTDPTL